MEGEKMDLMAQMETYLISNFGKSECHYDQMFIFTYGPEKFVFLLDQERDIVYGSGYNDYGVLGAGPVLSIKDMQSFKGTSKKIDNLCGKGILYFVSRDGHVLALTKDGKLLSWGGNSHVELGNGNTSSNVCKPHTVKGVNRAQCIFCWFVRGEILG